MSQGAQVETSITMDAIRMLADRDGSPDHTHVFTYLAGETYSETTAPRVSQDLMAGFVASGHALELDANGNPVSAPDARQTKVSGPSATKASPKASAPTAASEAASTLAADIEQAVETAVEEAATEAQPATDATAKEVGSK